jgi:hypothetical protein
MIIHYFIAAGAFFGIFILFLVLSKTLNNIINQFTKLQYLLQKEYDLKKEQIAIAKLMEEQKEKPAEDNTNEETARQDTPPVKNTNSTAH